MAVGIQVNLSGKLFSALAPHQVAEGAARTVQRLVEMGEERLNTILRPAPAGVFLSVSEARRGKASKGHYRRNINGRAQGPRGVIDDSGVVYGPWLEGISPRNSTTRFKGYASFRRTGDWLDSKAMGVARAEAARTVQALGGR